jgi:hypothetical protein
MYNPTSSQFFAQFQLNSCLHTLDQVGPDDVERGSKKTNF